MRRTIVILAVALCVSLIVSGVVWRALLTANRPMTRPLTADERRYGPGYDRELAAVLEERLPDPLRVRGTLEEVIDSFRDRGSIFVNWRAMEDAGISRFAPVQAEVGGMRLYDALNEILAVVGGGAGRLGSALDEGVITVSTVQDLSRNTMTRVYDVRDFAPTQAAPTAPPAPGRGQVLFTGPPSYPEIEALEAHVRSKIDPLSWRDDNAAGFASMRILGRNLIVNQSAANHHDITRLLEQLRWHRDLRAFGLRATISAVAAMALALIAQALLRWRRRVMRSREGLCRGCGYDLRASRDRCPECGRHIDAPPALTASPA